MLFSNQGRLIALFAKRVKQMLRVIIQRETAMRQAKHATTVSILTGKQARPAWRTRGRCAESFTKQHTLFSQALNIERWNGVPIWLNIAACIMRMKIENVRTSRVH